MIASGIAFVLGLLLIHSSSGNGVEAAIDNTTICADGAFDLYTQEVGETPCKTYERLRQICNAQYDLPTFPHVIPPEVCNEQYSGCCCNSAAWSLSMLCMTCQFGSKGGQGYDAPDGSYYKYLQGGRDSGSCSPQRNGTLPDDVKAAVCHQNIKIPDYIYSTPWKESGAWFFTYYMEQLTVDLKAGNFKRSGCDSSSESRSSSLTTGATVGIAVGAVAAGLAAISGLLVFLMKLRKTKRSNNAGDHERSSRPAIDPYIIKEPITSMSSLTPDRLEGRKSGMRRGPSPASSSPDPSVANNTNQRSHPFRHIDAGSVVPDMELPPAYGEQRSRSRPDA